MYKFQTKSIPSFAKVHGLFGSFHCTYCSNNLFSGNTAPFSLSGTAPACLERRKLIWEQMLESQLPLDWYKRYLLNGCRTTISRVTSLSELPSSLFASTVEGLGASFFATLIGCLRAVGKVITVTRVMKVKEISFVPYKFFQGLTEETAFGEHWLDSQRLLNRVLKEKNNLAIAHISFDRHDFF